MANLTLEQMRAGTQWNRKGAYPVLKTEAFHAVVYFTTDGDFAWVVTPIVRGRRAQYPVAIRAAAEFGRVATEVEGMQMVEDFLRRSRNQ